MATRTKHQAWDPPTQGFVQCYQNADEGVKEILDAAGTYCPSCYTVTRDLSIYAEASDSIGTKAPVVFWSFLLEDLVDAAESGCHLCGFIASRLLDDRNLTFFYSNNSNTQRVTTCCHLAARTDVHKDVLTSVENLRKLLERYPEAHFTIAVEPVQDYLEEEKKVGKVRFTLCITNLSDDVILKLLGYRSMIIVELYAVKDSRPAKHLRYHPVNPNPSSEACISQAKTWIQDCIANHPQCPGLPDCPLPTRVLKLVNDDTLQLYSGAEKAFYATLSYCWGGPQTFSTTLSTLKTYEDGFSISELPQTLQDAVQVTKRLGLEYIWIDSLCIIQDSPVDKGNEIPRMALYYKNAYITICASRDTCQETFLNTVDECTVHPGTGIAKDLLTLPYVLPEAGGGGVETIYFREESPYWLSWEPISKRAWTLQERILSPRVLMFGARTIWQCNTAQHSDGGNEDWSKDNRGSTYQRLQLDFTRSTPSQTKDADKTPIDGETPSATPTLYDTWYRAIHEYSSRALSYAEDKLPAVAGLAIEFSKLSEDAYLAGLWRSQLPRELLWSTYPSLRLLKPPTYRAPSWSWASVDNDITFARFPPADAECLATIISCSVTPKASESPFAEVSGGTLEIEGLVLKLNSERLGELVKRQYMVPAPRGKDYEWHRVLLNLMEKGRPSEGEDEEEWKLPEGTVLLVLFAVKDLEDEPEELVEEGCEKIESTGDVGDGEGDKKGDESKASENIEGTERGDDAETNGKIENLKTVEKETKSGNNAAKLYGLLISPSRDGTYERIAAITDLPIGGDWNLPGNRSRVMIV